MEHLSITFPEDLKEALDSEAEREHLKRSTLIQKAVKVYLALKRQRAVTDLLREGYQEMADELRKVTGDFKHADRQSLKYLD